MRIKVSSQVLMETRCGHGFACLFGRRGVCSAVCRAPGHMEKEALIIACAGGSPCTYQISFGSWSICSCPTRKEIYRRYDL